MNKTQLVDALTERLGDRRTATAAVEGLLETIVDTVRSGDSVSLTGFGVFEGRARAARTARNPRTGEAVDVPATTVPAFRPGAAFRSAVGGGGAPAPRSAPTRSRSTAAAPAAAPAAEAEPEETAAPAEKPARRKAAPKTTTRTAPKAAPEAAPEAAPKARTRTAKVGSSFAAPADKPAKAEKAEKADKAAKNGGGKAKSAGRSGEKPAKADDKGKKAKGKK